MYTVLGAIFGILFALIAVGALGMIALFFTCDLAADKEKKSTKPHENDSR